MIEILPVRDKQQLKPLFLNENLIPTDFSMAVVARFGDEVLGYCLFDLGENIVIRSITPTDDLMLADGILRSALHVAVENNILQAFWADNMSEELFVKLNFIDDLQERRLRIMKLFDSCQHCGK
ncbi:MAG: hypothetical protein Q4B04_05145 [bacterium]|nr:hypothetical protein [bacterium]